MQACYSSLLMKWRGGREVEAVADLVHQTFKWEGYIIENRPLTLHCTIINTSHRRPRNLRLPFSYTDS
ncbi:hypothetical protein BDQ17DRAFT_819876 [Cyathus striatus]|nr:hypothetical protein BDQ17DRAFT_819876 [Cyathus striatus]